MGKHLLFLQGSVYQRTNIGKDINVQKRDKFWSSAEVIIHSFLHSFIHWHSLIYSIIYSFNHLFIHLFIHSFTHSFGSVVIQYIHIRLVFKLLYHITTNYFFTFLIFSKKNKEDLRKRKKQKLGKQMNWKENEKRER